MFASLDHINNEVLSAKCPPKKSGGADVWPLVHPGVVHGARAAAGL